MRGTILAAAAGLALAGCDTISENTPDVEFRVFEPSQPAPETDVTPEELVRRPVVEVVDMELGAMRRGRLLTAVGLAPATEWFAPELQPRRGGRPGPDGFIEFDFVAAPPEFNGGEAGPQGTPAQRRLRAVRALEPEDLAGVAGVRVFAGSDVEAVRLAP